MQPLHLTPNYEAWRDLQRVLFHCEWEPVHPDDAGLKYSWSPTSFVARSDVEVQPQVRGCKYGEGDHRWQVVHIGPLNSTGGSDWHELTLGSAFRLSQQVFINQLVSVPIDPMFNVLSYPPIHNHHSRMSCAQGELLINHQDNSCNGHSGGVYCTMMAFQHDTAINIYPHDISLSVLLQDVREPNSQTMSTSVLAMIKYGTQSPRRSVLLWRVNANPSWYNAGDVGLFGTFAIPTNMPSVSWSSAALPVSGTMIKIWHHSHSLRGHVETWYVDASGDFLGMPSCHVADVTQLYSFPAIRIKPSSGFVVPLGWRAGATSKASQSDVARFKNNILKTMQDNALTLRCFSHRTNENIGLGDRQFQWNCSQQAYRLIEGQFITAIMFWDTSSLTSAVWQHHHYQAFVEIDGNIEFDEKIVTLVACPSASRLINANNLERSSALQNAKRIWFHPVSHVVMAVGMFLMRSSSKGWLT